MTIELCDSRIAYDLLNDCLLNGGGTSWYEPTFKPESGYVVALSGYEMTVPDNLLDHKEAFVHIVNAYINNVASLLGAGVGVWHNVDDGKVYLDTVVWIDKERTAITAGLRQGQLAIYDIENATVIDL